MITIIKIKCSGDGLDIDRIRMIKEVSPRKKLIIDANESWKDGDVESLVNQCGDLGVVMIEQPLSAHSDDALIQLDTVVDICADEACHTTADVEGLVGKYSMVNLKLDKTGGLTEAAQLIKKAQSCGLKVMIGCMVGPELAIRPARSLCANAVIVDIDGPMFLA